MTDVDLNWSAARERWAELAPLVRRVVRADGAAVVRIRQAGSRVTAFAHLPTKALVARTIVSEPDPVDGDSLGARRADVSVVGAHLLAWLDRSRADPPPRADAGWLTPLPPDGGWQRVDEVPDDIVRDLVRQGAMAHVDAANLALGARAAENLLDTPVLTVSGSGHAVELTNRTLSALTSMGFLPRGAHIIVAVAGRWTRVAAPYGSVFVANRSGGLGLA